MSNDLNQCNFIGRVGKDPEIKYMANGTAVAGLSIACGESWKDKNTGEKVEKTEWINLTAFGKLAEIIGEYVKKGSKLYVSGKFKTDKYQAQDGTDRYSTKVIINNMQMLDSKPQAPQDQHNTDKSNGYQPQQQDNTPAFEDDIPFR